MKISASIYSNNKDKSLEQLVRELDAHDIDMLHLDCADSEQVFEDIKRIRTISKTPIDLHIISSTPEKYFKQIEDLQIEYVSFQYENLGALPQLPQNSATKFGLSFINSTPVEVFEKAKNDYAFAVIMTTVPGQSGGIFSAESFQRIIDFKYRYPKTQLHIDGGVNNQVGFILRLLGVNAVVSGSYLLNHESLGAGMLSFHKTSSSPGLDFKIEDFVTPLKYLPVLNGSGNNFKNILQQIEKYGQGFVLVTDSTGKLAGIISNADVRRGVLKNLDNIDSLNAETLMNKTPVHITQNQTVSDMIRLLNNLNFIVLFLPVVDENNVLKGAVLLNHLTRV